MKEKLKKYAPVILGLTARTAAIVGLTATKADDEKVLPILTKIEEFLNDLETEEVNDAQ